jgi:hypothetical protein
MRSRPNVLVLAMSVGLWLAAGPSGTTVGAILACAHAHHAANVGTHHHEHDGPPAAPGPAPCFCDQMTVGNDALLSFALPVPMAFAVAVAAPPLDLAFAPRAAPHASFVASPPAPPPNPLV